MRKRVVSFTHGCTLGSARLGLTQGVREASTPGCSARHQSDLGRFSAQVTCADGPKSLGGSVASGKLSGSSSAGAFAQSRRFRRILREIWAYWPVARANMGVGVAGSGFAPDRLSIRFLRRGGVLGWAPTGVPSATPTQNIRSELREL